MTENPFPATATESGRLIPPDAVVRTRVIDSALELFEAYLRGDAAASPLGQPGEVVAVTGGPGTGKTLLAGVLRGRGAAAEPAAHSVYLQASGRKFVPLLVEFAGQLRADRGLLRDSVRQLYASLAADSLATWEPARPVVEELRAGRVADPVGLVQRLGLMESELLHRLDDRLLALTSNHRALATVLGLLLRPGFDDAVWNWLSGKPPADVLRDRGVLETLESDQSVLGTMGALVAVVCAAGHKLLVVLDELDLAFVDREQATGTFATPFRRFLTTAVDAGAFVLLLGLPSFVRALPDQVRERTGPIMEAGTFGREQVEQLIATRAPWELDPEVVTALEDLTGGVPRSVLSLCNRLVRAAGSDPVGPETVREAARVYVEEHDGLSFGDNLARMLQVRGAEFWREEYLGVTADSLVDFWVDLGADDRHAAILLVDNVIEPADRDELTRRVLAIQELKPDDYLLLVVLGFMTTSAQRELGELVGSEPVLVHPGRTTAEVDAALRDFANRVEEGVLDPVAGVNSQVRQVGREQSRTRAYSAKIARTVQQMLAERDSLLKAMQVSIDQLTQSGPAAEAASLPGVVEAMLEEALGVLDNLLARVDAVFADAFDAPPDRARDERLMLWSRFSGKPTEAAGSVVFLQRLILALRTALRRWYAADGPDSKLNEMMLIYNDALGRVTLRELDALSQITAGSAAERERLRVPSAAVPGDFAAALYFGELASKVQSALIGPTAIRRS